MGLVRRGSVVLGVIVCLVLTGLPPHAHTAPATAWQAVPAAGEGFALATAASLDKAALEVTGISQFAGAWGFNYLVHAPRPAIVGVTWQNPATQAKRLQFYVAAPAAFNVGSMALLMGETGKTIALSFPRALNYRVAGAFKPGASTDPQRVQLVLGGAKAGISYVLVSSGNARSSPAAPAGWRAQRFSALAAPGPSSSGFVEASTGTFNIAVGLKWTPLRYTHPIAPGDSATLFDGTSQPDFSSIVIVGIGMSRAPTLDPAAVNNGIAAALAANARWAQDNGLAAFPGGITFHPLMVVMPSTSQPDGGTAWDMTNWGGGWVFAPDYLPTGEEIFDGVPGSRPAAPSRPIPQAPPGPGIKDND